MRSFNIGGRQASLVSGMAVALAVFALAVFGTPSPQANAAPLEIFFTGFDIELTESPAGGVSVLTDADPAVGSPDDLISATFAFNGNVFDVITSDLSADLFVTGVPALTSGVPVVAPAGGTFDLNFPDGDFLSLDLDDVTVTYIDSTEVQFAFGASIASGFSQDLPAGAFEAPISLSFSTQIKDPPGITIGGNGVVGFSGVGTGEVRGELDPDTMGEIPEPGTGVLMALAGLMGGAIAVRKRLV